VITDLIRDFNEYVNWDYHEQMKAWELAPCAHMPDFNWYRSSLVRVEALKAGKVRNEECSDPSIFRDPESSTT
jgi:predicted methyltransferase